MTDRAAAERLDGTGPLLNLIERLILSGCSTLDEPNFDPMTFDVNEGLSDGCWFCGADVAWRTPIQKHEPSCPWIEAMDLLGQPHPTHEVEENA